MANQKRQFSIMVSSSAPNQITISIFNDENELIHSSTRALEGGFAEMFDVLVPENPVQWLSATKTMSTEF